MFVYVAGRRQGKTTTVVRWLLENPEYRVILVASEQDRSHVLREVNAQIRRAGFRGCAATKSYWEERVFVPSAGYYGRSLQLRGRDVEVAIDDLDQVLQVLLKVPLKFVTTTGTPVYAQDKRPPHDDIDGEYWEPERREIGGHRNVSSHPGS